MSQFALKRRWPRLAVSVKVTGQWWNGAGEGPHPLEALMLRLSEGGAMIRTEAKVPANSRVEMSFRLGLVQRYTPRAVVRWWRRTGEIRELGVQFDEPIPEVGRFVQAELEKLKARS